MHESFEELKSKINTAFCPMKQIEGNPILEYNRYIIFKNFKEIKIERDKKFGRDLTFDNYQELENEYKKGNLHPLDLKLTTTVYLDKLIKPVREHFEKNKKAKELYESLKGIKITK